MEPLPQVKTWTALESDQACTHWVSPTDRVRAAHHLLDSAARSNFRNPTSKGRRENGFVTAANRVFGHAQQCQKPGKTGWLICLFDRSRHQSLGWAPKPPAVVAVAARPQPKAVNRVLPLTLTCSPLVWPSVRAPVHLRPSISFSVGDYKPLHAYRLMFWRATLVDWRSRHERFPGYRC